MSKHLTEDQFARYFARQSTMAELQHIQQCAACAAELDHLASSISMFRNVVRNRIDARVAVHAPAIRVREDRPPVEATPLWNWALIVAVSFVLATIPFFITRPRQQFTDSATTDDADKLMREINLHLSRTIPAPMEPIMNLIPGNESISQLGGVQ